MVHREIRILFLLLSVVYIDSQMKPADEHGPEPPGPKPDLPESACGCGVAFSAYMSNRSATYQSLTMADKKVLLFDRVTANTGQYSTYTGQFRAPSRGMYAFTWTICVDSRFTDGGALRYGEYGTQLVNGRGVCGYLHIDTERRFDDACSTAFVVCRVFANNYVYITNIYAHQGRLLSINGQTRTTFSGWKLFD